MSRRTQWTAAAAAICFSVFAACSDAGSSEAASPEPREAIEVGRETPPAQAPSPMVVLPDGAMIEVEIAADDLARAQGLMFRENLRQDSGMLFLFPEPGIYPFWMKNTLIFLDILWLDAQGTIVHIAPMAEPCRGDPCRNYVPAHEALFVLELAGGEVERRGLSLGESLELRNLESVDIR